MTDQALLIQVPVKLNNIIWSITGLAPIGIKTSDEQEIPVKTSHPNTIINYVHIRLKSQNLNENMHMLSDITDLPGIDDGNKP